jgi:DNA polymerase sigma
VNKRTGYSSNYSALQSLYLALYDKPWKKTIKFIDTALIPIIKITSSDELNTMQMDISLQDGKHYGLKCVELVKSFMGEYEALEPLIFALKNLLKNANLNDPYTVNYILIFLGRTELIWSNSHGRFLFTISTRKQQADKNRRWQHRQTLS